MVEATHEELDQNQTADPTRQSEAIEDPNVYDSGAEKDDIFTEQVALSFSVRDPQDFSGHIVYNVKGSDLQGEWECKRRYNEFFLLQECLAKRWPSIVLPLVPPKKAVGNKDLVFLQERRFYLERFLRKLARYDFIINSQEFQIFARPQGLEVEKSLTRLPKLSSQQLYDRLKEATMTDDSGMNDQERDVLETSITEFQVYIKKAEPFLKKLKVDIASYLSKKQSLMQSYAGSHSALIEYEEKNLTFYQDYAPESIVISGGDGGALGERMRQAVENLRNPFTDLYHWVKGEIYDLGAFTVAISERKAVQANIKDLQKKIASTKTDIETLSQGKKSMSTMFKNSDDVGKIQNKLEMQERDLEAQGKLLDVMSLYLGRKVLPKFKTEKLALYSRIVQQFHVVEISNSHSLASFWAQVLKNSNVQHAVSAAAH